MDHDRLEFTLEPVFVGETHRSLSRIPGILRSALKLVRAMSTRKGLCKVPAWSRLKLMNAVRLLAKLHTLCTLIH